MDFEWCKVHGRPYGAVVALVLRCAKEIAPDAISIGSNKLEHALVARAGDPECRKVRVRRLWKRLRRHVHYLGKPTHAFKTLFDEVHTTADRATRPSVLMGL